MNITIKVLAAAAASVSGASAAPKSVPRDALVLEQGVSVRQFPDRRGKVVAKLPPCRELVLIEKTPPSPGGFAEAVFLDEKAKRVKRGWVRRDEQLYIFPEPRPALPRSDATPSVAFPWGVKSAQPGDPDYARVTRKEFLFACLEHPHPEKVRAIFTQILDRYGGDLTADEAVKLLPLLRYAAERDMPRIKELLQRWKEREEVVQFLAANPLFGPTVEEQQLQAAPTPPPTRPLAEPAAPGLLGYPVRTLATAGIVTAAVILLLALFLRGRRRTKADLPPPSDRGGGDDTGTGPTIE